MNQPESTKPTPRLPAIGEYVRGQGVLVAVETIPPPPQPPPATDYIFEEVFAYCALQHQGEAIKNLQSFNEFYGQGTAVSEAIKEMKEYAQRKGLGPDSDLEVVVIEEKIRYRRRPTQGPEQNFYDPAFCKFETLESWRGRQDLPEPVKRVVWSSKTGEALR